MSVALVVYVGHLNYSKMTRKFPAISDSKVYIIWWSISNLDALTTSKVFNDSDKKKPVRYLLHTLFRIEIFSIG